MSRTLNEMVKTSPHFSEIADSLEVDRAEYLPEKIEVREIDDDHQFARETIHASIQQSQQAIESLTQLAIVSQDPEAYDSLAKLVGSMVNASKQLIEMNEIQQKITKRTDDPHHGKTINQNLILTTTDLQRMLKNIGD